MSSYTLSDFENYNYSQNDVKKVLFLSIFSTSSQRLVNMCFPGSVLQCSHDSVAC